MQFEAAEEHLRAALASGAALTTRADAASTLGRCAIVSGGRSARAAADALTSLAEELRPADPGALARARLLSCWRSQRLSRNCASASPRNCSAFGTRPGATQVSRPWRASTAPMSSFCGESPPRPRWKKCRRRSRLACRAARSPTLRCWRCWRCGSASGMSWLTGCWTPRWNVPAGRATRPGRASSTRSAPRSRWRRVRCTMRRSRPRPGCCWWRSRISSRCSSSRWRSPCTSSAERWMPPPTWPRPARRSGLPDRAYVSEFLIARGRLRIAQGRLEEGVADLLWCGQRREARGLWWPSDWRAYAAPALAALGDKQLAAQARARAAGGGPAGRRARGAGHCRCAPRRWRSAGTRGWRCSREAVAVLERSSARLELAHALADLGAELSRSGRRTEGRDAQRRAIKLAGQCGAIALAERAMAELHAGPGRRARARADRPERADRGGVAGVPSGGRGADQP